MCTENCNITRGCCNPRILKYHLKFICMFSIFKNFTIDKENIYFYCPSAKCIHKYNKNKKRGMDNSRIKCILGMTFHSTNFVERKNNVFYRNIKLSHLYEYKCLLFLSFVAYSFVILLNKVSKNYSRYYYDSFLLEVCF